MRTTLTLDDDVAAKLKTESHRAGRPFREIVNDTLRRGLESRRAAIQQLAFKVTARDLGNLKPVSNGGAAPISGLSREAAALVAREAKMDQDQMIEILGLRFPRAAKSSKVKAIGNNFRHLAIFQ